MITKNEINYVTGWGSNVPYPGVEYMKETSKLLVDSFNKFNKECANKKYYMLLSNGEDFTLEINKHNLCYLLGIDYKNLSNDYFKVFREKVLGLYGVPRPYELLEALVKNIDKVIEYDYHKRGRVLNYYRIMLKCEVFQKLYNLSEGSFGVINIDKEEYMKNNPDCFFSDSVKFLYAKSGEENIPYVMMGIKKDKYATEENDLACIADTTLAPMNYQAFFKNQEVVIPVQILTVKDDEFCNKMMSEEEKKRLVEEYNEIITKNKIDNKMILNKKEKVLRRG